MPNQMNHEKCKKILSNAVDGRKDSIDENSPLAQAMKYAIKTIEAVEKEEKSFDIIVVNALVEHFKLVPLDTMDWVKPHALRKKLVKAFASAFVKLQMEKEKLAEKCRALSISNTMRRVEMQQGEIASLKQQLVQPECIDGEYQCKHVKENIIASDCVWCNLTAAEGGLATQRKIRLDLQHENNQLQSQLVQAQKDIQETNQKYKDIVNEKCVAPDEIHCTCVPALRQEIARLRALMDRERVEEIIDKSFLAIWADKGLTEELKENYQEEQLKGNIRHLATAILGKGGEGK